MEDVNSGEKRLWAHFVSSEDDHAKLRKVRAAQIPQSGMWSPHRPSRVLCGTCSREASPKKLFLTSSYFDSRRLLLSSSDLDDDVEQHVWPVSANSDEATAAYSILRQARLSPTRRVSALSEKPF